MLSGLDFCELTLFYHYNENILDIFYLGIWWHLIICMGRSLGIGQCGEIGDGLELGNCWGVSEIILCKSNKWNKNIYLWGIK
jgi:hypothetical protein